jgi:hypothetical protein
VARCSPLRSVRQSALVLFPNFLSFSRLISFYPQYFLTKIQLVISATQSTFGASPVRVSECLISFFSARELPGRPSVATKWGRATLAYKAHTDPSPRTIRHHYSIAPSSQRTFQVEVQSQATMGLPVCVLCLAQRCGSWSMQAPNTTEAAASF